MFGPLGRLLNKPMDRLVQDKKVARVMGIAPLPLNFIRSNFKLLPRLVLLRVIHA